MYTISEENYIKSIYHLQQHNRNVTTNELALKLDTKPASVTDMLKKLKAKKLLAYEKYYGVQLTAEGKKLALGIVRRHRLWEYFLVQHLKFGWSEVHEIAEQLEHIQSPMLVERLDVFLGEPRFDPHGDPIPDGKGKMENQHRISLLLVEKGTHAEICAVGNQTPELLAMLDARQLFIGTPLLVKNKYPFDNSIEISTAAMPLLNISEQLASQLFVKIINSTTHA